MLGDESTGQRRLTFRKSQGDYESIWFRCCGTGESGAESKDNTDWQRSDAAANGYGDKDTCRCPVRGSERKTWFGFGTKTYFEKWSDKCVNDGWIAKKAGKGKFEKP